MDNLPLRRSRFEQFLVDEFWWAFLCARKAKRSTVDEHRFEVNAMENVLNLVTAVMRREYKPNRGVAFIVRDPVVREIVAAPFRDRVIHHFLYNCCAEWWDRRFHADSYSCRKHKGTLYGQQRLKHHIIQSMNESECHRAFVAKLDLRGYFMSLNHDKLYERVCWGLERQFHDDKRTDEQNGILCHREDREKLYWTLRYLWHEIIFDEAMKGIRIRGDMNDWLDLPFAKSLFHQPKGQGIVIGNLTSQLLSNIYMDLFDRFITYELGYKHYGRYVDDFFVIVPIERKAQLLRDVQVMERFLRQEMVLTLHPTKRYFQETAKGVDFVGAVVYARCMVPSRRVRRKAYEAAYRLATTGEGHLDGIVARIGTTKHLNSYRFWERMFDTFGWEFEPKNERS